MQDRHHARSEYARWHYRLLNYNYVICPLTLLAALYAFARLYSPGKLVVITENEWNGFGFVHLLLSTLLAATCIPPYSNTWGLCLPIRPFRYAQSPLQRKMGTLRVCLVTKGTNFKTVLNSASCWDALKHPSIRFHIITEGDAAEKFRQALPSYIEVDAIPVSFCSRNAKHKARALEYFRQSQVLTKDDWVLHLDEESEIDASVVKACVDFVERGTAHIGMGTIYYNSANHWKNSVLSAAEVARVAEDFGRFQLPVRWCSRPLFGFMHGSWTLTNGEVENTVTWDTDCLAEDFWFALKAVSHGYKFGWLHAVVYEQPPGSFRDFFRQRRRWYTGIISIRNTVIRASLVISIIGPVLFSFSVWLRIFGYAMVIPQWHYYWSVWNDAAYAHSLFMSSVIQDMTTPGLSWPAVLQNAIEAVVLSPVVNALQAAAMLSSLAVPSKGFDIINKT
ncbi:glycosyltransferase family 2 protein [Aspergillus floccosus]